MAKTALLRTSSSSSLLSIMKTGCRCWANDAIVLPHASMISARMPTANDFSAVVLLGRCKEDYHETVQCSIVTMFILSISNCCVPGMSKAAITDHNLQSAQNINM